MAKQFKDKSYDADIHLDWQKRNATFENSKHLFKHKKRTIVAMVGGYFGMFGVFYAIIWYQTVSWKPITTGPTLLPLWELTLLSILATTFLYAITILPIMYQSTNTYLKSRSKHIPYTTIIQNPSGTIEYDCKFNAEPMVDLEFDNTVSAKLIKASMIAYKIPVNDRLLRFIKIKEIHRKKMVIFIDGTAEGTLIIKEYT